MAIVEPPRGQFILRLLVAPYHRGGIRLHKRAILLVYITFSIVWALGGPQIVRLYVPGLTASQIFLLTCMSIVIYLLDDLLAFWVIRPQLRRVEAWFHHPDRTKAAEVWKDAAAIPLVPLTRPGPLLVIATLIAGWITVMVHVQHLPLKSLLLFITGAVLYRSYWLTLRSMLTEQMMRPVLADISAFMKDFNGHVLLRLGLAPRLLTGIPMITVLAGTLVAGIVGPHTIATLATGVGLSALFSFTIAGPLLLLVTRSVTEPLRDLRQAARRVGNGDLTAQVPVTSTDEIGTLAMSFNSMIDGLAERERIRAAFGAYVDPTIAEHILANPGNRLADGEDVEITALFMDVRGFTGYSEQHAAREVVAMLNRLFSTVVPIIGEHGGYVDKFIGDGLLAVFGVPQRYPDHADRALVAALAIAAALQNRAGDPDVGIGLNSGKVVAGNIGGSGRFDFTVIGDPVNVAARVESATRQTGDTILLSEHTHDLLNPAAREATVARPAIPLKGKTQKINLYAAG